jgi:dolichol-phosphate mannosyltransferase
LRGRPGRTPEASCAAKKTQRISEFGGRKKPSSVDDTREGPPQNRQKRALIYRARYRATLNSTITTEDRSRKAFGDLRACHHLAQQERDRDAYFLHKDPIWRDRLEWQAHTFRHLVHLLPGETILEVAAGQGLFIDALRRLTRGQNRITALTFDEMQTEGQDCAVEWVIGSRADALGSRTFDCIIVHNMLHQPYAPLLIDWIFHRLKDGGQVVFFETNPWNPYHIVKRIAHRLLGRPSAPNSLNQLQLYELMSDIGLIRIVIRFTDFVYPPLPRSLIWFFKNISVVLENAPYVRALAGRILITARRPPREVPRPSMSLARHTALSGRLAIVVPCHNEESNVAPLVKGLFRHYDRYIRQIILVDDNSTDSTRSAIDELKRLDTRVCGVFRAPPNGVGRAIRDGLAAVEDGCEYVLTMDCDFQYLIPELEDLFDAVAAGHDAAVGSRFSRQSVLINYPLKKILANRGFHVLFGLLCRRRCRDLTNNLKLMRADVVRRLVLRSDAFAINAEIGLQLILMGCSVEEVPISWVNRSFDMGNSKFRMLKVGAGYMRVLADFARETRFGARPLLRPPVHKR